MRERNVEIDILKGIAILAVVIRHVMQYSVNDMGTVGNIIWAFQMPLFMLISGFLACREIAPKQELLKDIRKKIKSYMIPYLSWYFLIDILILGKYGSNILLSAYNIIWDVNNGLWFLWVVFWLSLFAGCVNTILWEIRSKKYRILAVTGFGLGIAGMLLFTGGIISMSFLGIKYILYYAVYFFTGYFIRRTYAYWKNSFIYIKRWIFLILFLLFSYIVLNYNLFLQSDNVISVCLRVMAGFFGSYLLYVFVYKYKERLCDLRIDRFGKYTLEIYCTHMSLCRLMSCDAGNSFFSVKGFTNFSISCIMTFFFSFLVIMILKTDSLTKQIFYGRGAEL